MSNIFAKKFFYLCILFVLTCGTSFSEERRAISDQAQTNEKPTQAQLRELSMKAYRENNSSEVMKYLTQAVELYPDNLLNHLNLGDYAYELAFANKKQGLEWEKFAHLAENKFLQTIEMKDQPEEILKQSGLTKGQARNTAGHAAYRLGEMYLRLFKDQKVAIKYFELAQSLAPTDRKIQRALDVLNQLQTEQKKTADAAGK